MAGGPAGLVLEVAQLGARQLRQRRVHVRTLHLVVYYAVVGLCCVVVYMCCGYLCCCVFICRYGCVLLVVFVRTLHLLSERQSPRRAAECRQGCV